MRKLAYIFSLLLTISTAAYADHTAPVSYYLSCDNIDFIGEDWVERSGLKTIEDRKWELVPGKFGKGLSIQALPLEFSESERSGYDLDLYAAIIWNVHNRKMKGVGYDEPFIWGPGKIHPGYGAVSFWVKGNCAPDVPDAKTVLFELTSSGWGRMDRRLMKVELFRDRTINAWVEDTRYVQHTIETKKVWKNGGWNHIVFMWDRASGLSLWVNGKEAASSTGDDPWWDTRLPGLFHLPMTQSVYDEFYIFDRPLESGEIRDLYKHNRPPHEEAKRPIADTSLLKQAFISSSSKLPVARPFAGTTLTFTEIMPERVHDEGVQGWWLSDGVTELAWPHDYTSFTIIPGDVDFHAEKADILPPKAADVNYITLEGNLDDVTILKGDRNSEFGKIPAVTVPETEAYFYGSMVDGLGNRELRIPFTKSYGIPEGYSSDGDALKLPLSGNLRIQETGLFHVVERPISSIPGDKAYRLMGHDAFPDGTRYPSALNAMFDGFDRTAIGAYLHQTGGAPSLRKLAPMRRTHILTEPVVGKAHVKAVIADLWISSPTDGNILQFRLRNPAVPNQTWTHGEVTLRGFTGDYSRLRIALEFEPLCLTGGDRLWLEIIATDGLTIVEGDPERPSSITLRTAFDVVDAENRYAMKAMRPAVLMYGRSYEYLPWEWDKRMPDVDEPEIFGGVFNVIYPWQAVLKVNRGERLANIYKAFTDLREDGTPEYNEGSWPRDMDAIPEKHFDGPSNAPEWAVHFREFQTFRNRIIAWWRQHQRADGQVGGGWNDDTLIFARSYGDLQLDSNADALALYNKVFDGFDRTGYFRDGYCRISPIDGTHNGDFVRERYKSIIYNLGDPRSAVWAMEEAWHYGKPEKTPINYGDGRAFMFGRDVLDWYWGRRTVEEPYRLEKPEIIFDALRKAATIHNDTLYWRYTDAYNHTDQQAQYGYYQLYDMLFGGWNTGGRTDDTNVTISVGVGWICGGGPQLGRLVRYSGNDGLSVEMYSFDAFDREVEMRLFRLAGGEYTVKMSADRDGDGVYEIGILNERQHIGRFDSLTLTVPPKTPVRLDITQESADPEPGPLPDLAVSGFFTTYDGGTLTAKVHNIGCAPSGAFTVSVIGANGGRIAEQRVESLPGSDDYVPKRTEVEFRNLSNIDGCTLVVDSADAIREIYEGNNRATIAR